MDQRNLRQVSAEVLYAEGPLLTLDPSHIARLKEGARLSDKGRMRICSHLSAEHALHEMIIALRRGTYIRPHKHMGKIESAHVIEGSVDVVLFDATGAVTQVLAMGEPNSGRLFYYRMADAIYHTLVIRSDFFVFHEVTEGPLRREQTVFAPWAPEEGDPRAAEFMAGVADSVEQFLARAHGDEAERV